MKGGDKYKVTITGIYEVTEEDADDFKSVAEMREYFKRNPEQLTRAQEEGHPQGHPQEVAMTKVTNRHKWDRGGIYDHKMVWVCRVCLHRRRMWKGKWAYLSRDSSGWANALRVAGPCPGDVSK